MTPVAAPARPAHSWRGLVAAIASISVFAFALSLSIPLISLLLNRMGASGFEIGLNGAASAVAILVSGVVLPFVLRGVSAPLLIVISTVGMSAALCLFLAFPNIWVWLGLRFLLGACAASIFYCAEIWIITAAPEGKRGLLIGVYGLFLSVGFLGGPLLLSFTGTEGWAPFIAGAGISLLAIPPVLWAWTAAPDLSPAEGAAAPSALDVVRFFRSDPTVLWAVVLFGCIEFGAMGLFPVWSLRVGLDERMALTLVALLAAGNVALQTPIGWISDRVDRRRLLALSALVCLVAALAFPSLAATRWPLWIVTAVWGGLAVGLYTFALVELGARYSGADLARGNGAFMTAYGLGALISPPLLGAAMDLRPPHGMFWVMAAMSGGYLVLVIRRAARPDA